MAIFDNFPYTNVHEMNYDWIIKKVKECIINFNELDKEVDDKIKELLDLLNYSIENYVEGYVDSHLSQFLLGAMYIEERTCIKLQQAEVIGDSDHVYDNGTESIIVLEGR